MVMYLSWKSTQICTNKIFRKSEDKYICQVWALGGQLHHHSSHLRDGRGKQLHDQGILLPQVGDVQGWPSQLDDVDQDGSVDNCGAILDVDKLDQVGGVE